MTINPSKKRSRRNFVDTEAKLDAPQEDVVQTSPILVGGGGSVGIDFDRNWYKYDPVTKRFSNPNDTLHKLWLVDKYGAHKDITPKDLECTVTINCGKANGKEYLVKIYGKPLGIEFDTGHFQYGKPPEGEKEIYHHPKRKILNITVYDRVSGDVPYKPPTKGKCSIVVVDKL